jgi:drug/metabolite transporter (DMT)-like permease
LYNVFTKQVLTNGWKERTSALVAIHQVLGAALLFLTIPFTGGFQLTHGMWWPIVATGVLNIGIMYGSMRARALEDVSLVTPIASTTPALVIITSMFILGELPSRTGWIGIWLLVAGTYVLNIQDVRQKLSERVGAKQASSWFARTVKTYFAPFFFLGKSRGVQWAFFACMLGAFSLNYDALVARRTNIGFGVGCVLLIAGAGNLVIALKRREFRGIKPVAAFRKSFGIGVLYAAALFVTNYGYRHAIVPYVGTMKRIQIPLTIILAYFILGERKSFSDRLMGGILMALGAVLISIGG